MLPAVPTKGHAPGITPKPRMLIRSFTYGNRARAGDEGLKITFDASWIDENMTVRAAEADEMV
jgi:hypothetical protein